MGDEQDSTSYTENKQNAFGKKDKSSSKYWEDVEMSEEERL